MSFANSTIQVKITKTLFFNTYRGIITDEEHNLLGTLRIIPGLPLDRNEVPADAPEVTPYLMVIVEDADITSDNLIIFEDKVSASVMHRLTTPDFAPEHCQFFYPSPAFMLDQPETELKQ